MLDPTDPLFLTALADTAQIEESYPLSSLQQGMLFHSLDSRESGVDIEQVICTLNENLQISALIRAWHIVIERHPILRTAFRCEGLAEPLQDVYSRRRIPVEQLDWRELSAEEQQHRWTALLQADRRRGFDLAEAPLMRLTLTSCRPQSFRFLWTFHHILLDGRSFPLVLREVFAFYEALRDGRNLELPRARSYREYVEWHREQNHAFAEQYWRRALKGFTTPTQLPLPRPAANAVGEYEHGAREVKLSSRATALLNTFAQDHDVTVNTMLQGAWAMLLHRYSGDRDIVFGATRACRRSAFAGADSMVGLLINTLPMRVQIGPDARLIDYLHELRAQQITLRKYEHTPLVEVQGWSEIPGGTSLFESVLVFENYLLDTRLRSQGGEWLNRHFEYIGQTNYPLTVVAYLDTELLLRIEYNRRRFDDGAVELMLGHLRTLLEGMVSDPVRQLRQLPMLTKSEEKVLLSHGGGEAVRFPIEQCLHQLFERQVERNPEAIAVTCDGTSLTYRELNRQANRLANKLRLLGVCPDVLVGLCVERSLELMVGILAILKAGGAYVPLDPAYPKDRLAFMVDDSAVSVLLTQDTVGLDFPSSGAAVLHFGITSREVSSNHTDDANPSSGVGSHNLAYVIYTSGSTGKPKGALIPHGNVVRLFHATEQWFHFDRQDVWTLFHSYAFDFSVWEMWGALLYGGRLVVVPQEVTRSPDAFASLVIAEQVTVINQTPSAFRQLMPRLISLAPPDQLAARLVIFGGEALDLQSLRPWFDRYGDQRPQLINMYGITETTVHVTYRPLTYADLTTGAGSVIGRPIPDLRIVVLDDERHLVPLGIPGEMYVGGDGVARGYLRRPDLTEERFIADPFQNARGKLYRTGDLARWLPNGDLEYLGRIDHQVKIRGFRIELGEIEAILGQHSAVRDVAVVAREDVPGEKRLVAYVVAQEDIAIGELRDFLSATLPDYMLPSAFVRLKSLPLTSNGKLDRSALPVPDNARPAMAKRLVAPRTSIEKTLGDIWSAVLGVETIGVHDNFFELGGDSILSIQVIVRARQAGLQLTTAELFKHPTVAALATICSTIGVHAEHRRATGPVALTPIQQWFFEQDLPEIHHWNQAFLFETAPDFDPALLAEALQHVAAHHDAFRLRFKREPSGWQQTCGDGPGEISLIRVDLSKLPRTEQEQALTSAATELQSSIDLAEGPIIRAGYFQLGSGKPGRLLLIAHHLAIDGVSWRILLEDLEAAYLARLAKRPVQLPARTTSLQTWAERLHQYAQQPCVRAELEYWRGVASGCLEASPIGAPAGGENREFSAQTITVRLSAEETQALLQHVPTAYRTQINEVLLAALQQCFAGLMGSESLLVDLEGHGREEIAGGVDVSRTIGWFTTIFPVKLDLNSNESIEDTLRTVKTELRRIPHHGIGYGALRYLSDDPSVPETLRSLPQPTLSFNYLGQFDQVLSHLSLFRFAGESCGPWHSPKGKRRYLLEVLALIQHGRFEAQWTFSQNLHRREHIEPLAERFLNALKIIIAGSAKNNARALVPADFPLAHLDQHLLDRVTREYENIEDLYPLSPMQRLFYAMEAAKSQVGIEQWHYTLEGPLDAQAFKRGWEGVIQRHAILRTAFVSEGLREPLQVVLEAVPLPWAEHDWRGLSAAEQERRLADLLAADRQPGFELRRAPLLRLTLIRTAATTYRLLWTTHHLLVDGWSWPVIFRDLSIFYAAAVHGVEPRLDDECPYRNYITWLQERSAGESEAFWRRELSGITAPTSLGLAHPERPAIAKSGEVAEELARLSSAATAALQAAARRHHLTLNTFVQGAWALLLSRYSDEEDVCFGAAFSGRPSDIDGIESMVGPCVNDLPVRVCVRAQQTLIPWLKGLQEKQLAAAQYQHISPMEIQNWSQIPSRYRLFESLVVFQNYLLGSAVHRLDSHIEVNAVTVPETTNYPITLLVVPGSEILLKILYRQDRFRVEDIRGVLQQVVAVLEAMTASPARSLRDIVSGLPAIPPPQNPPPSAAVDNGMATSSGGAPRTEMERIVLDLWRGLFQIEQLSIDANFFDLGGHSLLLVQMHKRLEQALNRAIPLANLFQHSTVRALARYLSGEPAGTPGLRDFQQRAARQQSALVGLARLSRKN